MTSIMRAKMKAVSVNTTKNGDNLCEIVTFAAVYKSGSYADDPLDEDNTYAKYTPQANATFVIANPALAGKFAIGDVFYVDFTPA